MRILFIIFSIIFSLELNAQSRQEASIYTSDVTNFWVAYDSVQTTNDTMRQINFIQKLYIDKGTLGIQYLTYVVKLSAKDWLSVILKYPKFWNSIRPNTNTILSYKADIDSIMYRFKKLYDKFDQPDIYFTIGCLHRGGTVFKNNILISSELATSNKDTDASELISFHQERIKLNRNLIFLLAHECVHTQQHHGIDTNTNVLSRCIQEGAADFIAEILTKQMTPAAYMSYGFAHEKEIWEEFKGDMYGSDFSKWLLNGRILKSGVADLGYFIGYAICKSYYENSNDKQKAIQEIITINYSDKWKVEQFLINSKYQQKWKN